MTEKYHETDPMSDVISDDYRMLQMISRFGIKLGFGDQTVAATCARAGVDVTTFLTVVNYLKDSAHAHLGEMAERISLPALMKYLKNSHAYFIDFSLPMIRSKLIEALDFSSTNNVSLLILKFFDDFHDEVRKHMEYENRSIFAYVEKLQRGEQPKGGITSLNSKHDQIDTKIRELKNIIIKYYPEQANNNLLNSVLFDIFNCEQDLDMHCQIEDYLFTPAVARLERRVQHG